MSEAAMAGNPEAGWYGTLERCGLQPIENTLLQDVLSVKSAIYSVTGFEVAPTATIQIAHPHAIDVLDREWQRYASENSLFSKTGEFIIIPPVSGGSEVGWVRVRDLVGGQLPSRVIAATGSAEFIAASLDGRRLCAVSVEDDEYWIVVRGLEPPGTSAPI
ncbi:hypothetical protein [Streptomyces sp. NPDC010273]|uniref:hypothetical protein n=1 Tax=Streptomyces sp. NPDC010273 TaxID=3364829 RepID=UPI0036E82801